MRSVPGLGRPPGQGSGNPLQYSCLKNPLGRGAWQATVQRVTKSRTWLSDWACTQRSPVFLAFLNNPVETFCRQLDTHCALASQLWICHLSFSLTASPLGAGTGSELFLFSVPRSPGYRNACWADMTYEHMEGGICTEWREGRRGGLNTTTTTKRHEKRRDSGTATNIYKSTKLWWVLINLVQKKRVSEIRSFSQFKN